MINILKKYSNQSTLFLIGMVFCGHLSAGNLSQESYQFSHKNKTLTCGFTSFPIGASQAVAPKLAVGDKNIKQNNVLKNSAVAKNSRIIDHQIFASPKKIKSVKRILI